MKPLRQLLAVIAGLFVGVAGITVANDFFTASGVPSTGAALSSATMRGEFANIGAGFDKMPTLTGNGNKVVTVNAGGTALTATAATALSGMVIGTNLQAWDADLDALSALSATGFATRTAANTWAQRTVTGTANEITVTNGDGVSGNPTLSLPSALTFTSKTVTGGTYTNPAYTTFALTDSATTTWNTDSGSSATWTMAASRTISAPTNLKTGGVYTLEVTMDSTGGWNITWNTAFRGVGGSVPHQPNPTPSAKTTYSFYSPDGTNLDLLTGASDTTLLQTAKAGRLTYTTATPVLVADVTAQATVYFTPYIGNFVELSQAASDSTKSPAATGASKVYDVFLWNDSGTVRSTRGPAWSSDTSRGTGAGTSELQRVGGVYVNKVAVTNGPGAFAGIYVGSIRSSAGSTYDFVAAPASAAGGGNARITLWNYFNRKVVSAHSRESTNSWSYTSATYRPLNNSTSNAVSVLEGLNEDYIDATTFAYASNDTAAVGIRSGIGLDSTSSNSAIFGGFFQTAGGQAGADLITNIVAKYFGTTGLGYHTLTALEYSDAVGTTNFYGDGGTSGLQAGISVVFMF